MTLFQTKVIWEWFVNFKYLKGCIPIFGHILIHKPFPFYVLIQSIRDCISFVPIILLDM